MASLSCSATPFTPLWKSSCPIFLSSSSVQFQNLRLQRWGSRALSKNTTARSGQQDSLKEAAIGEEKTPKSPRRAPRRRKKMASDTDIENDMLQIDSNDARDDITEAKVSDNEPKKVQRKGRTKVSASLNSDGEGTVKKVRRRTRRKKDSAESAGTDSEELDNIEKPSSPESIEQKDDRLQLEHDEEDISFTYAWPPLVCCFGAAHYAFIPSGRPANRLIDHEIHETMKDVFWSPTKFIRAPGGSSFSVALAHAAVGGRVAFMGKVGDDEYGQALLYHLNQNNVQTRCVKVDSSKLTSVASMKISRRGGLRLTCVRPCAEDSLKSSEINIDVLKEAKMFYFNSTSLHDQNMRSTTLQAIKVSKQFGGVIFFDVNLPLPLWKDSGETKKFISEAWNCADIIEVTKQELEFLCGGKPTEEFDTKNNDKSKFIHHNPDLVRTLWHENLKVLFVTNGTSKVHYYTEKDDGAVLGMEDAPVTPFTGDMSAAGDAVVAALIRMLTVQPHLVTDKGYLRHMIKYAVSCGVIDQWILARIRGYPPKGEIGDTTFDLNGIRSITEKEYRTLEPGMENLKEVEVASSKELLTQT